MNLQVKSTELPPFKPLPQKAPDIDVRRMPDGTVYIDSNHKLGPLHRSIAHLFVERAAAHPERNFIGERIPLPDGKTGDWRFITYGEAYNRARSIAQGLLSRGFTADTPLMILSGNSIVHATMALGAMLAGVPIAPVSVAYSLMSGDNSKLKHVFATTQPKMIFADNGPMFARALNALPLDGVEVVTVTPIPDRRTTSYDDLIRTNAGPDVAKALDRITHDTTAKYLFTSGSTGMPKGVIQTHRMMCAVIAATEALRTEPADPNEIPQSLEWMPWNHISAGNIGFNGQINAGGTIYLDAGKPVPGLFDETIRNLRDIVPLGIGTAPIAFGWLCDAMERDDTLRDHVFRKLRTAGYGGATLSQDIYERFQALAIASTGNRIPMTTMYGATETQGVTVVHWITERVGLVGLPLPGITLKLVPNGTKLEVRVKGPTVTPGYHKRDDLTKAAFDSEGFYSLGDAAKFLDDNDPMQGLVFDGRVTEDFKLDSGTWVSAGTLRAHAVAAASPLIFDCIVCGQDKPYVALLAWPVAAAAKEICGSADPNVIVKDEKIRAFIRDKFAAYNKGQSGSSTRIKRVILMAEPPSVDGHEITDKGYVNQRATMDRRRPLVDKLFAASPDPEVIEIP
ncbi:MAG: AMP-binding protein [Alphaproteobacteria bacterium]|nr:AMP-binding protein [Alphaproteobacteria bacterium]MBL7099369.1 AMP-binding protein [Alphaproteobacteria bacterium]